MSREPSPGLAKGIPDEQDSQSIRTLQKRRRRRRRQRFRSRASLLSLLPCTLAQLLFSTSFCRAFVYSPLLRPSVSRQLAWMDRWTQSSGLQRDTREVSRARGRGNDWGGALFWDTRGGRTPEEPPAPLLSVTTFNVLAPIFKRVSSGRESDSRDSYLERNVRILRHLNDLGSDVICLQELWVAEQEIVDLYQRCLEGYRMYTLPRTESRGDGVACFVKQGIEVLDRQDIRLKGVGGRVGLILHLGVPAGGEMMRELVIANTHLMFPHARTYSILRSMELKKLLAFMECYTRTNELTRLPVVLCGDFNGNSTGRVYQHLTDRGFRCSYEDTLVSGTDRSRWITHVNHLGDQVGVDFVWYRNPDPRLGPMELDWERIVYQSTKQRLLETFTDAASSASKPEERQTQTTLEADTAGNRGRLSKGGDLAGNERDRLSAACKLLGLSEGFELDDEELQLLLDSSADDFDFLIPTIMDGSSTGLEGAARGPHSTTSSLGESQPRPEAGCVLETAYSRIWPPSLEKGVWPADYNISDHGSLTTYFRMAAPSPINGLSTAGDSRVGSPLLRASTAVPQEAFAVGLGGNLTDALDSLGGDDGHYGWR